MQTFSHEVLLGHDELGCSRHEPKQWCLPGAPHEWRHRPGTADGQSTASAESCTANPQVANGLGFRAGPWRRPFGAGGGGAEFIKIMHSILSYRLRTWWCNYVLEVSDDSLGLASETEPFQEHTPHFCQGDRLGTHLLGQLLHLHCTVMNWLMPGQGSPCCTAWPAAVSSPWTWVQPRTMQGSSSRTHSSAMLN